MLREFFHNYLVSLMHLERRYEPFWRYRADELLREPLANLLQAAINATRERESCGLAEERVRPGEEAALDSIIADMGAYMRRKYRPGEYERVGNTKTHGLVRADFIVSDGLPEHLRRGVLREPRTYPAWVRYSGPGPDSPPDIEDVGFLSMSVKLMQVPGPKLLDDEKHTQDFTSVCTPTFVTPDVFANAQLQSQLLLRTPLYYFFHWRRHHVRDFLMQSLWNETQTSPLECQYYSCVPYLLGVGQAMQYSFRPTEKTRTPIPNLPGRPPDNYLRDAMAARLERGPVEFDFLIQLQTDPHAMPIENSAVRWPLELSPYIPVAKVRIHEQRFDSPAQLEFAKVLRFTPWHALPEHRPLGSLNRARRRMYETLSALRLEQNRVAHYEPTGRETFEDQAVAEGPTPTERSRPSRAPASKSRARKAGSDGGGHGFGAVGSA